MSEEGVEWISFLFVSEYTVLFDGGDKVLSLYNVSSHRNSSILHFRRGGRHRKPKTLFCYH